MRNYIKQANLNVLNGTLSGTIRFAPGLNLIGGENGTFKTKLLQNLRGGAAIANVPGSALRIQSVNPKRNSERRAAEQIWQSFRQQNRTLDIVLNERIAAQINDSGFENYPSLGDLYYLVFEHRTKDGGDRKKHMDDVVEEFNRVIQSVFHQYRLVADWNETTGAPRIKIRKGPTTEFPIEGLSLGEQEILGLITSLYTSRDRIDVYLIDEPEVHLNWHLEEKLFAFLDDLCETHGKQAIVVTHSRAMFTPRFMPKAQFLYWEGDKVRWGPNLTPDQQRRIAGEAIQIIRLGDFSKPTFFVEDAAHVRLLEAVARCYGTSVAMTQCGTSSNVKSLFKLSELEGGWPGATFIVDGDNEGNSYPGAPRYVHLPVYCSDNLLLHPEHLAAAFSRTVGDIQNAIHGSILERRTQILKKNRFFEFLLDHLQPNHLTYERIGKLDGSEIIDAVASNLGTNTSALTDKVIAYLHESKQLEGHLPPSLVGALQPPPAAPKPDEGKPAA